MTRQIFPRLMVTLLACGVCCVAGGCDLVGVAASRASSVAPVKAEYVPNNKDPMLVLVESYGLLLDSPIETEHMTLSLNKAMADNKVAPLIDQQALEKLRDADPRQYESMSIADIGRRLGAEQVLYVNISRAELERPPGSGQVRGQMEAVVKIVDCQSAERLWPIDSPSELVQITTKWVPQAADAADNQVRAQMSDQMADDIGKLFHDHPPDDEPAPKVNLE
jgi:hypothetical protein